MLINQTDILFVYFTLKLAGHTGRRESSDFQNRWYFDFITVSAETCQPKYVLSNDRSVFRAVLKIIGNSSLIPSQTHWTFYKTEAQHLDRRFVGANILPQSRPRILVSAVGGVGERYEASFPIITLLLKKIKLKKKKKPQHLSVSVKREGARHMKVKENPLSLLSLPAWVRGSSSGYLAWQ